MPWLVARGLPNGARSFAYWMDSLIQNCAAPKEDASLADAILVEEMLDNPKPCLLRQR